MAQWNSKAGPGAAGCTETSCSDVIKSQDPASPGLSPIESERKLELATLTVVEEVKILALVAWLVYAYAWAPVESGSRRRQHERQLLRIDFDLELISNAISTQNASRPHRGLSFNHRELKARGFS